MQILSNLSAICAKRKTKLMLYSLYCTCLAFVLLAASGKFQLTINYLLIAHKSVKYIL